MNENNETIITNEEQKQKNKASRMKFFVGAILLLAAIGVGLVIGYKKLNNDPVSIYKDAINMLYNRVDDSLNGGKFRADLKSDPLHMGVKFKIDSSLSELEKFTGFNYSLDSGIDIKNNKAYLEAKITEEKEQIVDLIASIVDKNVYLKSTELFNKVIKIETFDEDSEFKLDFEDFKFDINLLTNTLKSLKTIMIDSLVKDKFTMDHETITINGKEYNAKMVTYKLDEENLKRTLEFFKKEILKNESLLNNLATITNLEVSEIKESLESDTHLTELKDIDIIVYADNFNNIIAGKVIYQDVDKYELMISKDNNMIFVDFSLANDSLNLTIEESNSREKIDYTINIDGMTLNGEVDLKSTKDTKDENAINFKFSINTSILGQDVNLSITGDASLDKSNVIVNDSTDSVDIYDLTTDDVEKIYSNLEKILNKLDLTSILDS